MSTKARLSRLEQQVAQKGGMGSFVGSRRFFDCLCGSRQPTPAEQAEWEQWLHEHPLPAPDRVEQELARLRAELPNPPAAALPAVASAEGAHHDTSAQRPL